MDFKKNNLGAFLFLAFLISLFFGQFGSISLGNSVFMYLHDTILLVLTIVYRKKILASFIDKTFRPLLLFIAVCMVSLVIQLPVSPTNEVVRGGLYFVRFILYSSIASIVIHQTVNRLRLLQLLTGIGTGFAMIGFVQLAFFPSLRSLMGAGWDEHYRRMFGTLFDPNFLGMILVLTLLSWLNFVTAFKKQRLVLKQTWVWLVVFVVLVGLVLSYSRSAYLALIAGLAVFTVSFKLYKYLFLAVLIFACVYLIIPQGQFDANRISREVSSIARIQNWQTSLAYIAEKPILGHGFNLIRYRIGQDLPINVGGIVSRDRSGLDSSVLFVFATTGIIGGVIYLWWLWQQLQVYARYHDKLLGTIGIASLSSVFVFSWFNNGLFYPWVLLWLMVLLGIALKKE